MIKRLVFKRTGCLTAAATTICDSYGILARDLAFKSKEEFYRDDNNSEQEEELKELHYQNFERRRLAQIAMIAEIIRQKIVDDDPEEVLTSTPR